MRKKGTELEALLRPILLDFAKQIETALQDQKKPDRYVANMLKDAAALGSAKRK